MKKFYLIFVVAAIIFVGFLFDFNKVQSSSTEDVLGYAWSDNIGWISFNCKNLETCATVDYGVKMDTSSGDLTGYAWSDSIGWIQFGGLSGFPPNTTSVNAYLEKEGRIVGWARAITFPTYGWADGWISLSDPNQNYGVYVNEKDGSVHTSDDKKYAWGSNVIGWIDFSGVVFPAIKTGVPTVKLTSTDYSFQKNTDSAVLSWKGTNIFPDGITDGNNCELDRADALYDPGSIPGSISSPAGTIEIPAGSLPVDEGNIPTPYTFSVRCLGVDGSTYSASSPITIYVYPEGICMDPNAINYLGMPVGPCLYPPPSITLSPYCTTADEATSKGVIVLNGEWLAPSQNPGYTCTSNYFNPNTGESNEITLWTAFPVPPSALRPFDAGEYKITCTNGTNTIESTVQSSCPNNPLCSEFPAECPAGKKIPKYKEN